MRTEFTLAYVEDKLEEHGLLENAELNEMLPGKRFQLGPFTIHPIQVTHSIVDAVSLAVHTPLGVIIHTGDFKIDLTPTDNKMFDLHAFAEYGKEGVLALLQDSTNVERAGFTPSERAVRPKFEEIFVHARRRLFVSCFSSSIHRIKMATEMAHQFHRKIALVGRSLTESTEIAQDLGYINLPASAFITPGQIRDYPPEQVMVMISGTQGEPMSALSRAAVDNHRHAKIEPGDTVVLSSRVIPGNEKGDLPRHRPPVPPRRQGDLRRRLQAAGARQRTRQPGRVEADHQPGAAAILHSYSRRIPPTEAPCRTGGRNEGRGRKRDHDRDRRHSGIRRTGRAARGRGSSGPHLHRLRLELGYCRGDSSSAIAST